MHRGCNDIYGSSTMMQAQRGHRWYISAGTDARVSNIVVVRVRHGIDNRAGHLWHLAIVLVLEEQSNLRLY